LDKLIYTILLTCFVSLHALAQEEVYRWVDENGNVHYADQPKNANAKRFILRNNNYSQPAVNEQELQQNNEALAAINANVSSNSSTTTSGYDNAQASPENACNYLRAQMNNAKLELNSNDLSKVEQARIYLEEAEKLLKDGKCNE